MIVWEGKSLVVTLFKTWAKTSVSDYFLAYQAMVNHHPHREWVKIIDFTDYAETSDLLDFLYADEFKQIRKDIAEWSVKRGMIRQVIILVPGIPKDVIEQLIHIYDNSGAPAETVPSRHEASVRAEKVLKGYD